MSCLNKSLNILVVLCVLSACEPAHQFTKRSQADLAGDGYTTAKLPAAYAEFDSMGMNIFMDGEEVVIESNGLPNHTSPYWSNTTERSMDGHLTPAATKNHPLFVEPTVTSYKQMAPGNIDDFRGMYTLRVPVKPERSIQSFATGLGPIGIAVSGSMIYNDKEGPNLPLEEAASSLDYTGAHTGPQSYHYHLEPIAWSKDDDALIGVIADGFFLYGRRDVDGSYPSDLDGSGGHFAATPHNKAGEYHYHIQNTRYLNRYYLLFSGDYQGTPASVR